MFKKSTKKIWLSRLLLITMILTLLPASAWAEEPVQPVEIKLPDSIVEALTWQGATSSNPFGSAKDYNLFLLGAGSDATLQNFHESEGPVAVNGDVDSCCETHNGQFCFSPYPWAGVGQPPTEVKIGAVVNGNITASRDPLPIGNGVFVAREGATLPKIDAERNAHWGTVERTYHGVYHSSAEMLDNFFSAAADDLLSMNVELLEWPTTGTIVTKTDGVELQGDDTLTTQVFTFTSDQLNSKKMLSVYLDGAAKQSSIIINVKASGDTRELSLPFNVEPLTVSPGYGLSPYDAKIIFNIDPKITTINLDSGTYLQGSLLAPKADVVVHAAGSSVNGHLVAKSLDGQGTAFECHWIPWSGSLKKPTVPSYPELTITKNIESVPGTTSGPQEDAAFDFEVVGADNTTVYGEARITVIAGESTTTGNVQWNKAALKNYFSEKENTSLSLTLREKADAANEHWQYDTTTYTMTMSLDANGDYVLTDDNIPEAGLSFTNKYVNKPVKIPVQKQIIRGDERPAYDKWPESAANSTFTVGLYSAGQDTPITAVELSAANDWQGTLTIEKPSKLQTYTLQEIVPDPVPAGWQYAEPITVTITSEGKVTYHSENIESTTLSANDTLPITNTYNSTQLAVTKKLVNVPGFTTIDDLTFSFGLFTSETASEPLRTATVDPRSYGETTQTLAALFTDIPAPLGDIPYTYVVRELADAPLSGWQYDQRTYTITVSQDGTVSWDGMNTEDKSLLFTNVHQAAVSFTKFVEAQGVNAALPDTYAFTFTLTPADEVTPAIEPDSITLSKTADKSFSSIGSFSNIPVPAEGMYTYQLAETQESVQGWQYDTAQYIVTIDSEGQVTYYNAKDLESPLAQPQFKNIYKTPTSIEMTKQLRHQRNNQSSAVPAGSYEFTFSIFSDAAMTTDTQVGTALAVLTSNGSQLTPKAHLEFKLNTEFGILADGMYYIREDALNTANWQANEQRFRITVEQNQVSQYALYDSTDNQYHPIEPAEAIFENVYITSSTNPGPGPEPGPGQTPGSDSSYTPNNEPNQVITEPAIPLNQLPIVEPAEEEVIIEAQPVPLSDNPKTGSTESAGRYGLIALLAAALLYTFLPEKKHQA